MAPRVTRGRRARALARGGAIGVAVSLSVLVLALTPPVHVAESRSYDLRAQWLADPARADSSIVIVAIDDNSLDVYRDVLGRWPWPRDAYVYMLEYLRYAGAGLVVFDVLFSEPDLARPHADSAFAEAIGAGDVVLPAVFRPGDAATARAWEVDRGRSMETAGLLRGSIGRGRESGGAEFVEAPLELLAGGAAGIGAVNFNPDADGVSRGERLTYEFRGRTYASLPLAAARLLDPARFGGEPRGTERELTIGATRIPLHSGRLVIRWRGRYFDEVGGSGAYRVVPAARLLNSYEQVLAGLEPDVPPASLAGKTVLVGLTGVGLFEARPTPLAPHDPGVIIHATVLDNLLRGDPVRRTGPLADAALVAGATLATALIVALAGSGWVAALATVAVFASVALISVLLLWSGVWIGLAAPLLGVGVAFGATMTVNYMTEGREKRRVRELFGRYVPPEYARQLADDYQALKLGGERVPLTVLFSDIRGFTGISERLPPEAVVSILNEYLERMAEVVFRHGGTLDKFIGDAVMAFWGAPLPAADHARRAVEAALDMEAELAALNRRWAEAGDGVELEIGIGINTGEAIVGNIGSLTRKLDYTAIGDTVNLASRLEGLNRDFGTRILVSEATLALLGGGYRVRPLGAARVKGKEESVAVYEVEGRAGAPPAGAAAVVALLLGCVLAAPLAAQSGPARWTDWVYQPGHWRAAELVPHATVNADTDSLALLARVDVYARAPRWRAEVRAVVAGRTSGETIVVIGDGARAVVLTPLGSTPLAEHAAGRDPAVAAIVASFDATGTPRFGEGRHAQREGGQVARVIVRAPARRGEFPEHLLAAGSGGRAARSLVRLGVQSLNEGRSQAVVASAAARGVTRVRTPDGEMERRPLDLLELEAFLRAGRLGPYAAAARPEDTE
jgi:adenylate cyclase